MHNYTFIQIFCSLFLTISSYSALSQSTNSLEKKLNQVFSPKIVESITSDSEKTAYFDFLTEKSFSVSIGKNDKSIPVANTFTKKQNNVVSTISAEEFLSEYENGTLNILSFELARRADEYKYIALGKTGYVLALFPLNNFSTSNK